MQLEKFGIEDWAAIMKYSPELMKYCKLNVDEINEIKNLMRIADEMI